MGVQRPGVWGVLVFRSGTYGGASEKEPTDATTMATLHKYSYANSVLLANDPVQHWSQTCGCTPTVAQ